MDGIVGKLIGVIAVLGLCAVLYVTLNQGVEDKNKVVVTDIKKPTTTQFEPN